jgi:hypothetical protein
MNAIVNPVVPEEEEELNFDTNFNKINEVPYAKVAPKRGTPRELTYKEKNTSSFSTIFFPTSDKNKDTEEEIYKFIDTSGYNEDIYYHHPKYEREKEEVKKNESNLIEKEEKEEIHTKSYVLFNNQSPKEDDVEIEYIGRWVPKGKDGDKDLMIIEEDKNKLDTLTKEIFHHKRREIKTKENMTKLQKNILDVKGENVRLKYKIEELQRTEKENNKLINDILHSHKQPVKKEEEISLEGKCKICYENSINSVFIPCGHVVSCMTCAVLIKGNCVICRMPITNIVQTFTG